MFFRFRIASPLKLVGSTLLRANRLAAILIASSSSNESSSFSTRSRKILWQIGDLLPFQACKAVGINPDTFYSWLKKNPKFPAQMEGAAAARELQWLKDIESGPKNWTSKAWLLQRSNPQKGGASVSAGGKTLSPKSEK
jgi:hypothetical protein